MREMVTSFKSFLIECKRILIITRKPTTMEFKTITKVTGIGILVIGAIGFAVLLITEIIAGI